MVKRKLKNTSEIYEVPLLIKVRFWTAAILILLPSLTLFIPNIFSTWIGYFMIFETLLACSLLWIISLSMVQTYYVVDEEGIEYHEGAMTLFSTWDNLREFKISGPSRDFDLHTQTALERQCPRWQKWIYASQQTHSIPMNTLTRIRNARGMFNDLYLEAYVRRLETTPLGLALRHYAPHLFVKSDADEAEKRKRLETEIAVQDGELASLQDYESSFERPIKDDDGDA